MTLEEPRLAHTRVRDVMHTGILSTDPNTPLRVVAGLMAKQRVHAVAVADPDHARRPWGIVSALDVARAVAADIDETASEAATDEIVTVTSDELIDVAARTMVEHGLCHVIVVDPATGHPTGVLSALDIAAAYAR